MTTAIAKPTNVNHEIKGDILFIGIDMTKRNGKSKSGKTTIVGSTHGSVKLPNGVVFSVNAYTKE